MPNKKPEDRVNARHKEYQRKYFVELFRYWLKIGLFAAGLFVGIGTFIYLNFLMTDRMNVVAVQFPTFQNSPMQLDGFYTGHEQIEFEDDQPSLKFSRADSGSITINPSSRAAAPFQFSGRDRTLILCTTLKGALRKNGDEPSTPVVLFRSEDSLDDEVFEELDSNQPAKHWVEFEELLDGAIAFGHDSKKAFFPVSLFRKQKKNLILVCNVDESESICELPDQNSSFVGEVEKLWESKYRDRVDDDLNVFLWLSHSANESNHYDQFKFGSGITSYFLNAFEYQSTRYNRDAGGQIFYNDLKDAITTQVATDVGTFQNSIQTPLFLEQSDVEFENLLVLRNTKIEKPFLSRRKRDVKTGEKINGLWDRLSKIADLLILEDPIQYQNLLMRLIDLERSWLVGAEISDTALENSFGDLPLDAELNSCHLYRIASNSASKSKAKNAFAETSLWFKNFDLLNKAGETAFDLSVYEKSRTDKPKPSAESNGEVVDEVVDGEEQESITSEWQKFAGQDPGVVLWRSLTSNAIPSANAIAAMWNSNEFQQVRRGLDDGTRLDIETVYLNRLLTELDWNEGNHEIVRQSILCRDASSQFVAKVHPLIFPEVENEFRKLDNERRLLEDKLFANDRAELAIDFKDLKEEFEALLKRANQMQKRVIEHRQLCLLLPHRIRYVYEKVHDGIQLPQEVDPSARFSSLVSDYDRLQRLLLQQNQPGFVEEEVVNLRSDFEDIDQKMGWKVELDELKNVDDNNLIYRNHRSAMRLIVSPVFSTLSNRVEIRNSICSNEVNREGEVVLKRNEFPATQGLESALKQYQKIIEKNRQLDGENVRSLIERKKFVRTGNFFSTQFPVDYRDVDQNAGKDLNRQAVNHTLQSLVDRSTFDFWKKPAVGNADYFERAARQIISSRIAPKDVPHKSEKLETLVDLVDLSADIEKGTFISELGSSDKQVSYSLDGSRFSWATDKNGPEELVWRKRTSNGEALFDLSTGGPTSEFFKKNSKQQKVDYLFRGHIASLQIAQADSTPPPTPPSITRSSITHQVDRIPLPEIKVNRTKPVVRHHIMVLIDCSGSMENKTFPRNFEKVTSDAVKMTLAKRKVNQFIEEIAGNRNCRLDICAFGATSRYEDSNVDDRDFAELEKRWVRLGNPNAIEPRNDLIRLHKGLSAEIVSEKNFREFQDATNLLKGRGQTPLYMGISASLRELTTAFDDSESSVSRHLVIISDGIDLTTKNSNSEYDESSLGSSAEKAVRKIASQIRDTGSSVYFFNFAGDKLENLNPRDFSGELKVLRETISDENNSLAAKRDPKNEFWNVRIKSSEAWRKIRARFNSALSIRNQDLGKGTFDVFDLRNGDNSLSKQLKAISSLPEAKLIVNSFQNEPPHLSKPFPKYSDNNFDKTGIVFRPPNSFRGDFETQLSIESLDASLAKIAFPFFHGVNLEFEFNESKQTIKPKSTSNRNNHSNRNNQFERLNRKLDAPLRWKNGLYKNLAIWKEGYSKNGETIFQFWNQDGFTIPPDIAVLQLDFGKTLITIPDFEFKLTNQSPIPSETGLVENGQNVCRIGFAKVSIDELLKAVPELDKKIPCKFKLFLIPRNRKQQPFLPFAPIGFDKTEDSKLENGISLSVTPDLGSDDISTFKFVIPARKDERAEFPIIQPITDSKGVNLDLMQASNAVKRSRVYKAGKLTSYEFEFRISRTESAKVQFGLWYFNSKEFSEFEVEFDDYFVFETTN